MQEKSKTTVTLLKQTVIKLYKLILYWGGCIVDGAAKFFK